MAINPKSLENLKQNRRGQTEAAPESMPILPIEAAPDALVQIQQVAKDGESGRNTAAEFIARCQPVMAQELVRIALARKTPTSFKLQALLEGLTIGGTRQASGRAATPPLAPMGRAELEAFILAGSKALEMRKVASLAVDAEVVSSPAAS